MEYVKNTRGGVKNDLLPSVQKYNSIDELISNCPQNQIIGDNLIRAWSIINNPKYKKIFCSISGGSDSDIMLDIVWKCDKDNKVEYVWFDTGLEYQATKDHLRFLKEKYNINIKVKKAIKSIPTCCKEYGQPFLSKHVSEMMARLQRHNFQWEDEPYDVLLQRYSKCTVALRWWCNANPIINGHKSRFNIENNKWLKEFILHNKPEFLISNKCCEYAKKKIAHKLNNEYDLNIVGIRKAEGGARQAVYKNCFDDNDTQCDIYRPIFWYKNEDKKQYENAYYIQNSICYSEYELKRTGCAGCPYGNDFEFELGVIQRYEPKLYKAVNNIFEDSYEYTRKYREFCEKMKNERR